MKLNESTKVLDHLLQGLVKGFKYAEESYFEERSQRRPYTIALLTSDDDGKKVAITLNILVQRDPKVSFTECGKRLWEYAEEYLAEEGGVFNIKLSQTRTFGKYTLVLEMK
jgi:hypothetical protein